MFASLVWFPKKILRGQGLEWETFLIDTIGGCSMWFTSALVIAYITIVILLLSRIKSIWFYVGVGVLVANVGKIAFDSGLLYLIIITSLGIGRVLCQQYFTCR